MEDLQKEKAEYYKNLDTKSQGSKLTTASKITQSNAYLYGKSDLDKMHELN